MNLLMLFCASIAAMALGVLVAYGICRGGFAVLRIHARSLALQRAGIRHSSKPQIARLT